MNIYELEKKLEMLRITINEKKYAVDEDMLKTFESKNELNLSDDYCYFLSKYGDSFFDTDAYYKATEKSPWTPKDGLEQIDYFISFRQLKILYSEIIANNLCIPNFLCPIAYTPGGNAICIGVKNEYIGKIFFWDHEARGSKDVYYVAENFSDFIKSFQIVKKEYTESKITWS